MQIRNVKGIVTRISPRIPVNKDNLIPKRPKKLAIDIPVTRLGIMRGIRTEPNKMLFPLKLYRTIAYAPDKPSGVLMIAVTPDTVMLFLRVDLIIGFLIISLNQSNVKPLIGRTCVSLVLKEKVIRIPIGV